MVISPTRESLPSRKSTWLISTALEEIGPAFTAPKRSSVATASATSLEPDITRAIAVCDSSERLSRRLGIRYEIVAPVRAIPSTSRSTSGGGSGRGTGLEEIRRALDVQLR